MSGVLKVVGTIAGIVAMIPSPIQPIAAAVAVAANIGAQLTASKPIRANGSVNGIMIGADAAAPYPMGETYLGGVLRHDTGYGGTVKKVPNPYRGMVVDYAVAGPIHSYTGLYADFAEIAFSGNAATGYFSGFLYADRQLGTCPEPGALAPQFGGMPGWSASSKLSGKAAVLFNLKLDKDGKVFASGVPQLGAKLKGVLAYDPRKDSTYPGGSGSHRIGDESTYEWTDNPALHAITYTYGRYQNGIKVFGIGQTLDGLIMSQFVEWANVCEANGWKIGGTIYEPGDRWDNLKNILMAGGAEPAFNGGQLGLKINAPKVAVDTITFDDLADDDVSICGMQTWRARLNGIVPSYRSEPHQWEYRPSTLVSVPTFVAEDGEEKNQERQWNLVQDKDQVAQLAAYDLYNGRELAPIDLVCKPRVRNYGPGTKLIIDLPDYGMDALPCIVVRKSFDPATMKVSLTLMSETDAKHDFALGRTGTAPPTPTITGTEELDDGSDLNNIGRPTADYAADVEYSFGMVVVMPNGSTWTYIHDTPSTGNAPPDTDYWGALTGPTRYEDGTPIDDLKPATPGATRNVFRGEWAADTVYVQGDYFTFQGERWDVIANHTSSGGSPPPNANVQRTVERGSNTAIVVLIQRNDSSSAPAVPDNNIDLTFLTGALAGSLDGWSLVDPGIGSGFNRWETRANVAGSAPTATIIPSDWGAPALTQAETLSNSGLTVTATGVPAAADGTVSPTDMAALGTQFFVKRDESIITDDASVSFTKESEDGGTATINTATNAPVSGKPKGWVTVNTLTADIATFAFRATVGSKTIDATYRVTKDKGIPGEPGVSSSLIRLYKRTTTNSAPAVPDNDITLTFADNTLSGSLDGWERTEPPVTVGPWLWETFAFATGTDATFVFAPSAWLATPNLLSNDDYRAVPDTTGWTVPAAADGSIDPAFLPLEGQLYFRTSSLILLGPSTSAAGVTLAVVSDGGGTVTLNTAANTPISGKPKGFFRITALAAGVDPTDVVLKATYGGVDYPTLPIRVAKAIAGESVVDLRVIGSRTNIMRDAFGRIWPASQTTTIEAERINFAGGTTSWTIQDGNGNYLTPVTDYLSASTGDVITIDADKVVAAAGATRQVTIWAGNGGVSKPWVIQTDGMPAPSDNLWPDPQLNTGSTYWPVAPAAPWFLQTDGVTAGYQFKNYIWLYTSGSTSEVYLKVADNIPVRAAGEKIYLGFAGGRVAGTATFAGGVYVKWYDAAGSQIGSAAKVTTSAALSPSSDWPQYNGEVVVPSDAATFEIGYVRSSVGTVSAASIYIAAPYAQRTPPDADRTVANQVQLILPKEEQVVAVSYDGASVKSHPASLRAKLMQGNTDLSASAAWTLANSYNITSGRMTIGASGGTGGLMAITGKASGIETFLGPAYVDVVAVYGNNVFRGRQYFRYVFDFVPQAAGIVSDSPIASQVEVSNTSFTTTPVIGPMKVTAEGGGILVNMVGLIRPKDNSGELELRPEIRISGSGSAYTQVGSASTGQVVADADDPRYGKLGVQVSIVTFAGNLITNGVTYDIQFVARKINPVSGTAASAMIMEPGSYWVQP